MHSNMQGESIVSRVRNHRIRLKMMLGDSRFLERSERHQNN